ncbi:hypothetical protein KY309_01875 [Candidatus Woesearchaeota archaeon]|nr:hypothetical protein [Candidatus Woesearchaeota archaeon]MBW3016337.1 hypothetical protein [Candidatus Woesearchaeota archaeon]
MRALFLVILTILLIGCTLQEAEVNQILVDLDNMGKSLDQLENLAQRQDFDGFKQNVELANVSLENIRAWVDVADERGEDKAFIIRVKNDYEYLSIQFETLILNADVVQKLEAAKPYMEELKQKNVEHLDVAISLMGDILVLIDKISANIDEMEAAADKMTAEDRKLLNSDEALSKMRSFEKDVSQRKGEFQGLKNQLQDIRKRMN